MSVREKRLRNEHQALLELVGNAGGSIIITSATGNPPYQYVIDYRCRGIEKLKEKKPVFRSNHRVEISLSNQYPREQPSVKFLTPIFHPNVYSNKDVCLGSYWTMAETVPQLVIRIGKIIQYSKDVLNLNSPANSKAESWAAKNMSLFPVDSQTFKSQIIWGDIK
ncbi:ubiquitin-conjugating enzyme E2 [Okeania sp. SIO2B3]|uniref:ubiquitin-conjugating enzyme E2 n=1 Tax=Okeania sp. SIO2B3 TaxID=2607784 RepID=UPI0013C22A1C|nr:ubiquitin-conjugating enzyme E2 [Okeania sp. SIO2B3]NET45199.1 ubiquitin-conjugating enzyme E2 [Okeania sp. SIO2B3]